MILQGHIDQMAEVILQMCQVHTEESSGHQSEHFLGDIAVRSHNSGSLFDTGVDKISNHGTNDLVYYILLIVTWTTKSHSQRIICLLGTRFPAGLFDRFTSQSCRQIHSEAYLAIMFEY